jgi:membrane peptidoglycan carboxypeptidase
MGVMSLLIVGVGALMAKMEWDKWENRAKTFDYTKLTEMESASVIFDRSGQVLGRIFIQNRDEVGSDQLSPEIIKAVVGAEDARFYQHDGVDYFGILRAMVKNYQAGRTRQGASTISQQLARNTFPEQLPSSDRSYGRKILEMAVARQIEKQISKREILTLYLNRVFFGSGFYGAEAAARGYFGKHASELTLSEAATLTGLLKSPNNLSPWRNRQACIDNRNYVLQRLYELKMISKEEYETTRAEDLTVKNRRPIHQESYAAELVAQQVKRQVGEEESLSEGYRIYTTIDLALQKKLESTLRERLAIVERREGFDHQTFAQFDQIIRGYRRKYATEGEAAGPQPEPEYLQGSGVVLENGTGGILALVGGRDFGHSPYNRALSAKRPVGTAFKPMVYAAAFENGLFPGTVVQDSVIDNRQVMIGGTTGILGEWGPERVDNKYEGMISARTALVKSKNAATVRLGMTIGKNLNDSLDRLASLTKTAGIDSEVRKFPAAFLGSSEMTLMEMTLASTIFPTGGIRPVKPFIIERIEEKNGRVVFQEKPARQKVIRPTTAYEVHSCLAEVLERGTADRTFTDLGLKRASLGGKTGTAYNFTDVWFLGYSSEVTCGVWAGFDKQRTPIYRGAFSNEIALPIWANVMKETFATYKPQEIGPPKGLLKVEVCAATGLLATNKCFETSENKETGEKVQRRTTFFEICTEAQAPKDACDLHGDVPRTYVKADPRGDGKWPRAAAVATEIRNTPVQIKAQTVVGNDPYNSIQAVNNVVAMKALEGKTAPLDSSGKVQPPAGGEEKEMEVRRAEAVRPLEQAPLIDSTIKLEPPKPIEF